MLPPQTAFTSVRYADHWFWIDDEDYSSKRAFTFLLLLSALVESAGDGRAPLVTIPYRVITWQRQLARRAGAARGRPALIRVASSSTARAMPATRAP